MAKPRERLNSTTLFESRPPPFFYFRENADTTKTSTFNAPCFSLLPVEPCNAFFHALCLRRGNSQSNKPQWPRPRNSRNPLPIEMRKDGHADRREQSGLKNGANCLNRTKLNVNHASHVYTGSRLLRPGLAGVRACQGARPARSPSPPPCSAYHIFSLQENPNGPPVCQRGAVTWPVYLQSCETPPKLAYVGM